MVGDPWNVGTVAVLGATGGTGVHVVEVARDRGYSVRVLVRNPGKVPDPWWNDEGVVVLEGDALDADAVYRLVEGSDAVVSVLGHAGGSPPDLLERSMGCILEAMDAHGVQRLVVQTGAGVERPGDAPSLLGRFISWLLARLQPELLADSVAMTHRVQASGVDWTVVRAVRLTDGDPTGTVEAGPLGSGMRPLVARADVASFLVDQLASTTFLHEAPAVGS